MSSPRSSRTSGRRFGRLDPGFERPAAFGIVAGAGIARGPGIPSPALRWARQVDSREWERGCRLVERPAVQRHRHSAHRPEGQRQVQRVEDQRGRAAVPMLTRRSRGSTVPGRNVRSREPTEPPRPPPRRARGGLDRLEVLGSKPPGLSRSGRILTIRNARPVSSDKVRAVRRIWPPPSPLDPSRVTNFGARSVATQIPPLPEPRFRARLDRPPGAGEARRAWRG